MNFSLRLGYLYTLPTSSCFSNASGNQSCINRFPCFHLDNSFICSSVIVNVFIKLYLIINKFIKYSDIKNLGTTYKEGYITTDENGKCGIVSTTKIQILENKYNEIKQVYLGDNYYVVEDGEEKIINQAGETLIDKGFDDIKSSTKRGIIFTQKDLYGEMTTSGDILIEAKYKDLKEAKEGIYIAKKDEKSITDSLEWNYLQKKGGVDF
jgi:hypothetical protein